MQGDCAGLSVQSVTTRVYTYKCVSVDSVLYRDLSWDKQVVGCVGGSLPGAKVCLRGQAAHGEGASLSRYLDGISICTSEQQGSASVLQLNLSCNTIKIQGEQYCSLIEFMLAPCCLKLFFVDLKQSSCLQGTLIFFHLFQQQAKILQKDKSSNQVFLMKNYCLSYTVPFRLLLCLITQVCDLQHPFGGTVLPCNILFGRLFAICSCELPSFKFMLL